MKRPEVNRHVALVLTMLVAVMMPVADLAAAKTMASQGAKTPFSGEEMINGLLFGRGPVAAQYPELSPQTLVNVAVPQLDAKTARVLDSVVARMAQRDPVFFDRFQAAMTSGDHYLIRASIEEAGDLLWKSMTDVAQTDREAGAALAQVNELARRPTEAHGDAVLVALVAVALILFIVAIIPISYEPGSQLAVEQWVDRIATTLHH